MHKLLSTNFEMAPMFPTSCFTMYVSLGIWLHEIYLCCERLDYSLCCIQPDLTSAPSRPHNPTQTRLAQATTNEPKRSFNKHQRVYHHTIMSQNLSTVILYSQSSGPHIVSSHEALSSALFSRHPVVLASRIGLSLL